MSTAKKLGLLIAVCLMPLPAAAYVDPGAGMLVWQGLVAGIGALIAFLRGPREAVRRMWERLTRK